MPKKKDKFYIYILWMTKSYNNLTLIWVGVLVIGFELTPLSETC